MVLAEQIKEAAARRDTLYRCLDIEQRRIDLRNEEEKTQEPDFWNDPAKRANSCARWRASRRGLRSTTPWTSWSRTSS